MSQIREVGSFTKENQALPTPLSCANNNPDCVALTLDDRDDPESPPAPSLFLCPSNLSALLETATLSLGVASGEASPSRARDRSVLREEGSQTGRHTAVPRGQDSQASCEKEQERETQTLEIHLPLNGYHGVRAIHDPSLPRLAPPIPVDAVTDRVTISPPAVQVHQPPSLLQTPLLSSPIRTHGEPSHSPHASHPHTSPLHTRLDHAQDRLLCSQLSIPMDQIDEEEGACQVPPVPHAYPYSQRSSMASSMSSVPTNEGEIPHGFYRPDLYQTHSRNVSETPSVPPFHCSSTSSAYHSRNSSFGSQFSSSCFESDNMLTDIDSLFAVPSGSHGDLKHPIRVQDSRLGDSSRMSYTSEWSLRHHKNQPIGSSNYSPNLEETLQNVCLESLEERKKHSSMKSSEWIKRQLGKCRDSLVQVKVSSKTKHVVHFNVRAGDVIVWEFATKKKDIAFGVLFEATQVAIEEPAEEEESPEDKIVSILPMFRMNTHARPVFGTHTATRDGVYEIVFDNTYSRFFAKELFYRITTLPPEPNSNYSQQ